MRALVFTFALAGCDAVFGVTPGEPAIDASIDVSVDVPVAVTCPDPGTPLVFQPVAHQVAMSLSEYSVDEAGSTATAVGLNNVIHIGPPAGPFTPVADFAAVGTQRFDVPRLAPEGDTLFVREWDTETFVSQLHAFQRGGAAYEIAYDVTLSGSTFQTSMRHGVPSRGPSRRMFIRDPGLGTVEVEVSDIGRAEVLRAYTDEDLGVTTVFQTPNLTPDGLRMVFFGGTPVGGRAMYSVRESVAESFPAATPIDGIPSASLTDAFLTANCARLYYASSGFLFYVER